MSFSSITDENTVNILPMYNKLVKINNRLQLREKWSKFIQLTNKNNRVSVANKLIQYEKTLILYKKKQKKKFFNKWKNKSKIKLSIDQDYQERAPSQSKRIIWKKLSQKLIKRNRFTYLIVDVSNLFKFRAMKRCFYLWVEKLLYSRSALREKWKYLMTRRLHREVILRIYNVQSIFHTRVIWRDFIDRILRQYYRNNLEIAKNTELIRQNWIFLSEKSTHEQILKRLYQVKSKLKTRAVWQYFLNKMKVNYLRSIFISLQSQYELKRKKKLSIRSKWASLFCSFHKYSHQKSIQSISKYLETRSSWRSIIRKLYFSSLKVSLTKGLAEINYRREQIRRKLLLKSTFEQWFIHSVSENKLKQVYDEALAIFVPTFRQNSALLIQKIFRLHLKHQKEIQDMIFNNLTFDLFIQTHLSETTKHFFTPISLPHKICIPLVNLISSNEAKTNYNLNFYHTKQKMIDNSFNLKCFSEIGLKELNFFSTDKNFPTPQIDLIIDHFDFDDFDFSIQTNICFYKKEKIPKFTEKRIHEDVIQYLEVEPEFDLLFHTKVDRFRFNRLKKSELIESIFDRETSFSIEDELESSFDFEFLLNHHDHLIEYEAFNQVPKTEATFGITNEISEDYSGMIHEEILKERSRQFLKLIDMNSVMAKFNHYKSFSSQTSKIKKHNEKRVSMLTFSVDDRLIKKKKFGSNNFFVSKYSLFQTGIDFLFSERFFINGFFFTPRISRFFAVDSMIDSDNFSNLLPIVYLNSSLCESNSKLIVANPIGQEITEKVSNGHEFAVNFLSREIEIDEIECNPDINLNSLSFYSVKRGQNSKESIQDKFLNLYMSEFEEEEEIQLDLIEFDVNHSKLNVSIEKRPCDVISFYANQSIDSSIISLCDFEVNLNSPISTFSIKDDRAFLSVALADSVAAQIVVSALNSMPIVSNLPTAQTIFEITSDFLSNVSLSPPRLLRNTRRLDLLGSKDPASLVEKKNVEIQFNSLFDEIKLPLVPNGVSQNFDVGFDLNFDELLTGISKQYGVGNLEHIQANDERAFISNDVIDDFLNSSERSILGSIPLNSNLPKNDTLIEISEGFEIFNESINQFASFGLDNQSLLNYTMIDDRMFYDERINDQITLNILNEVFNGSIFPIVQNVPTEEDIKLIADEFFDFCNISTKVPLSPIKRIEMKEEKSVISNSEIFNEFSSLLHSIDFPIAPNQPFENTVDEIAAIFYDSSDIICYFSGFENIIPLVLFQSKDDMAFAPQFLCDQLCLQFFNDINIPLILNDVNNDRVQQIAFPSIENIDNDVIGTILFGIKPSFSNYNRKDDCCFVNHDLIDNSVKNMFDSVFHSENILCSNLPSNETIGEIADVFLDSGVDSIFNVSLSSLSNIEIKDVRVYVNEKMIDKITMSVFDSIFNPDLKILCKNLPKPETINEIAEIFADTNVDQFSTLSISHLMNIETIDQRIYVNENMTDKIALNIFDSIFNSNFNLLCKNLPKTETINEIAVIFSDTNVNHFSTPNISHLMNIEIKDLRMYVNENMTDKIALNIFDSIFDSNFKLLCKNLPKAETIHEIAEIFSDTNVDQFSTPNISHLMNIESIDLRMYVNENMVDKITLNIFDSIFDSNFKLLCKNLPKTETINEIAEIFPDTNVDQFSVLNLSHLMNIESIDQRMYVNENKIDKIITNIFDSIFDSEAKILCENLPRDETITEIADDLIDSNIDSISDLSISSLSNIELKDQRVYVNERIIDEIISSIFESIFDSEKKILCSNLPDEETVVEIVDEQFVDSRVDQFSDFDISPLLNIELKDQRIYINRNIIEKIYSKIFESIFSDENILYLNRPEDEAINEIVYHLYDTSVDHFSSVNDLSYLSNFQLKDDQIFIKLQILDSLTKKIINDEINNIPIISNSVDSNLVSEIINVPEFHDTFCEISPLFNFSTFSIENFAIKDDRSYCFWSDVDSLLKSAIPEKFPIVLNDFSEKDSLHFFDFIDFKEVLKTVVTDEFRKHRIRFNRKDDRSFLKSDEIEALYFSAFFDAIDSGLLEKNLPSNNSINEITFSEYEKVTSVDDLFENERCLNALSRFEKRESKSFFSNEKADDFSYSILNAIQLPLIENDVDSSIINEITNFVVSKNNVFDLDFRFPFNLRTNSLNSISPYERRIKIDKKIITEITEIELRYIFNQNLPIVPNVFHIEDVRKIANSINLSYAFSFLPKMSANSIANLTKQEKLVRVDDSDLYETLIFKILYEQVLPMIPIRKSDNSYVENNTKTELFYEDDDDDD